MQDSEKSIEKFGHKIAVFGDKKIRRAFHKGEWYFSIVDAIEVVSSSTTPRWWDLKTQLAGNEGLLSCTEKSYI
jgi:hypothetical protein